MSETLRHYLDMLQPYLDRHITELAINKPGELWLEECGKWVPYEVPELTEKWLNQFSILVANKQDQEIGAKKPLLSTTLSSGLRIQIVKPPAVVAGTYIVAIRKPGSEAFSWDYYRKSGFFEYGIAYEIGRSNIDTQLLNFKENRQYEEFLRLAIESKKNIIVSGATSTGKTTFTNLLLSTIPQDERIATIEDAEELRLPHRNVIRLLYSKGGQGVAKVTPEDLLESCLRLTPDRIILAEIRGAEAFAFMDTIFSGHDGCITSMHASSPEKALRRLELMFKKSEIGRGFDTKDIKAMLYSQVDVIVQVKKNREGRRFLHEIYFDPARQNKVEHAEQYREERGLKVA